MTPAALTALAAPRSSTAVLYDLYLLLKPRVVALIVLTTAAGYYLGSGSPLDLGRLALTLLGTALAAGGALAINQHLERDLDARMRRTSGRPLPAGRIEPLSALAWGVALVALGLPLLTFAVDPIAGLVTTLTVGLYLFAYTPLKRRSALCTVIGALPGALPPVTGWAAASGGLGPGAFALFGILFFWQLPHSLAIARLYRDDYGNAGIRVLPVVDLGGRLTGRQMVLNALALLAASMLPGFAGIAGSAYLVAALGLGIAFLALCVAFTRDDSTRSARVVFLASLIYEPALFLALVLDRTPR